MSPFTPWDTPDPDSKPERTEMGRRVHVPKGSPCVRRVTLTWEKDGFDPNLSTRVYLTYYHLDLYVCLEGTLPFSPFV